MKNEIFICECNSPEHQFLITFEDSYFVITPYLSPYLNFFKRLILGIKYIFGYKSSYGAFDSIMLSKKRAEQLSSKIMIEIKKENKRQELDRLLFQIEDCFNICNLLLESQYNRDTKDKWDYAIFDLLAYQRALRDLLNEV